MKHFLDLKSVILEKWYLRRSLQMDNFGPQPDIAIFGFWHCTSIQSGQVKFDHWTYGLREIVTVFTRVFNSSTQKFVIYVEPFYNNAPLYFALVILISPVYIELTIWLPYTLESFLFRVRNGQQLF